MSRPARARQQAVEAARTLIRNRGVRSLTLEALATGSEVSRGGILYHWPNRRTLIRGLIERDIEEWQQQGRDLSESGDGVAGDIRCRLDPRDGVGTLAVSLIPEAREDEETWTRVKRADQARFRHWNWDDAGLARYILLLASEAAFWRRMHGLAPDVPELDARVRAEIERRLADIARDAADGR